MDLSCLLLVISSKLQFAPKALILSRKISREYRHCSVAVIALVTNQRPASRRFSQSAASDVSRCDTDKVGMSSCLQAAAALWALSVWARCPDPGLREHTRVRSTLASLGGLACWYKYSSFPAHTSSWEQGIVMVTFRVGDICTVLYCAVLYCDICNAIIISLVTSPASSDSWLPLVTLSVTFFSLFNSASPVIISMMEMQKCSKR